MTDEDLSDSRQPESVAAVLKVFAILQALAERSGTGISELSVRLAMPKATVYRFLQTMKTLGYVNQDGETERYALAMKTFELGSRALQVPDLVELAKHPMQMLADHTGGVPRVLNRAAALAFEVAATAGQKHTDAEAVLDALDQLGLVSETPAPAVLPLTQPVEPRPATTKKTTKRKTA